MVAKMLRQTRMTILLSLNAVVILIVGIMIFSAINLNGGIEFKVVSERSDTIADSLDELGLISPGIVTIEAPVVTPSGGGSQGGSATATGGGGGTTVVNGGHGISNAAVPSGELWNETAITMYQTADFDICVGGGLTNLGEMYWQTSNPSVIKGFYNAARTWLGYSSDTCRYPLIVGTGTTTITAGTYDGARNDRITITVIAPPVEQWKRDVLALVNQERAKNGLGALAWGATCENAATVRAREIMTSYSHTRPDGSTFDTACAVPASGGKAGENLNAGNAAVSPETVVASWMASPEHRANILDPSFKYMAVGFIFDPNSTYKTYWSQFFSTY